MIYRVSMWGQRVGSLSVISRKPFTALSSFLLNTWIYPIYDDRASHCVYCHNHHMEVIIADECLRARWLLYVTSQGIGTIEKTAWDFDDWLTVLHHSITLG
jgi:hypothetical protein